MKILVLTSFYYPDVGGVPVFLDCLIKNLASTETQFIVITKGYSDSLQTELNGTKVYRLEAFRKFREILGKSWKNAVSKRFEILSSAKEYAKSIADLLANEPPSIVHAHDVPSYLLGCEISSIFDIPLIFTSHSVPTTLQGIPYSEEGLVFWKDLYKEARYDILTVGSNFALTKCLEAGAPQNKVEVIPPGVDVEKFRPGLSGEIVRLKLKLESKSALIFSPVRPDPRKGLIDVLEASTKLLQHLENFFIFVLSFLR
ncbi:MAG: glycosyltransferase family 4 protein [Thermoproteota archaeon]